VQTFKRIIQLTIVTTGLGLGAYAIGVEGGADQPGAHPGQEGCSEHFGGPPPHGSREKGLDKHLTALRTELKLNPEQETAWTKWSGFVTDQVKNKHEGRPDFKALDALPAPERIEKWIGFTKEKTASLEAGLEATKTFYSSLSAEQRQAFDRQFSLLGPHGWKGKHSRD
jgi:periplasmic protein CpxP/Spy